MARPAKKRTILSMPASEGFVPLGAADTGLEDAVNLNMEEYEAIRLIDYLGMSHDQCAEMMHVSRPTISGIYSSARMKIADSIVNEKPLVISGGNYEIHESNLATAHIQYETEDKKMKVAVTYENGQVFQHFGHCENFKIYTVEDGKITDANVENAAGSGHGALAGFLRDLGVDTLICGGIGAGAQNALTDMGIKFYGGVTGSADEAVDALINGTLQYNANVMCSHHGDGHGEGHSCGHHGHGHSEGHGCGENKHGCAGSDGHGGCGRQ